MNKFASRLVETLKVRNISQSELARRLSVTQPTVSQWASGKREPSLDLLLEVCKQLDETADYLIGLED